MKTKYKIIYFSIFSLILFNFLLIQGSPSQILTLSIHKDLGVDIGQKIQGSFFVRGSGTNSIVQLKLYLNNECVADCSSNSLEYNLNTENYSTGKYNITLKGWNSEGLLFQISEEKEFMKPEINIYLTLSIAIFGIVAIMEGIRVYKKKCTRIKAEFY